jgi:hypothetical protein
LFRKPKDETDVKAADGWFGRIAGRLLNGSRLHVGGRPHRFAEVEFYYHGPHHLDPFTHRDPVQLECGRWYFHKTRGVYRGGSFKGIDLSFGDGVAHGGVLIRSLEKPDGSLIDGPSLLVDHLLDATGAGDVASLDRAINRRLAWETGNPLFLEWADLEPKEVYRMARVGLTLKRSKPHSPAPHFLMMPYRALNEPRRISKGKLHLVLALHAAGQSADAINASSGCPKATVRRYVEDFEAGKQKPDFAPYFGKELTPQDLCRLRGAWQAKWGGT